MAIEEKYSEDVQKLLDMGKEKAFLTYDDINQELPEGFVSPDDIEDIFATLGAQGIAISDSEEKFLESAAATANADKKLDEMQEEELELDLSPGTLDKTNDPVRLYLREMGVVPLLTREGEVAIAKRIERGQAPRPESDLALAGRGRRDSPARRGALAGRDLDPRGGHFHRAGGDHRGEDRGVPQYTLDDDRGDRQGPQEDAEPLREVRRPSRSARPSSTACAAGWRASGSSSRSSSGCSSSPPRIVERLVGAMRRGASTRSTRPSARSRSSSARSSASARPRSRRSAQEAAPRRQAPHLADRGAAPRHAAIELRRAVETHRRGRRRGRAGQEASWSKRTSASSSRSPRSTPTAASSSST